MPKSCIICSAEASPDVQLRYCDQCLSALYCSRACQRIDWKPQHRQICKLLNVGHEDRQVRTDEHNSRQIELKSRFERGERSLGEDNKRFFKIFQESTFEGSQAAAQKMRKFAKRQSKHNQNFLLWYSLQFLILSDSQILSMPKNSPLLVMLQFVDPSVLFGDDEISFTPLHHLANLPDPFDYSTHVNQLILAKQLIEHGANVNTVSTPLDMTPLHRACSSAVVTNLDFIELLLEAGADPNAQYPKGMTPLMCIPPRMLPVLPNFC
jgi:hypothetical protein